MKFVPILSLLAGMAAVAACVPRSEPPPPPEPRPVQRPRPVPPPPPAPQDWRDAPLTPGGWTYNGEGRDAQARFGTTGAAAFVVRCDRDRRQILLSRAGPSNGAAMTVRTSFGARNFPVTAQAAPLPGVAASLVADDRFLDSMVFSRGRFSVEMAGAPTLLIPTWPEPARVLEDCRG